MIIVMAAESGLLGRIFDVGTGWLLRETEAASDRSLALSGGERSRYRWADNG